MSVSFNGRTSGFSTETYERHSALFTGTFRYFHLNNTSLYQGTVKSDNFLQVQGDNSGGSLIWQFRNSHNFSSENRFFVKRGNFFLGSHLRLDGGHSHYNYISDSTVNQMSVLFSPTLSFGWGRLEPVNFAREAMDIEYILNQDRIIEGMSDEELTTLADKIALASNRRFFDVRHKRMYELETIDSTIESLGFVPKRNMRYFSRLQDSYFYAIGNSRLSGMRHEIGFNLQGVFDIYHYNEFDPVGGAFFYNFSYHLPQSFALQHDVVSRLRGNSHFIQLRNSYNIGIYPTTRTAISFGASIGALYNIDTDTFGGYIGGSGRITYYISPRFRLGAYYGFSFRENYLTNPIIDLNSDDRFFYNLGLGISYAIF